LIKAECSVKFVQRERERETDILIPQSKLIEKCDNKLMLICADKNVITLLIISERKKKKKKKNSCISPALGFAAALLRLHHEPNMFIPVMVAATDAIPIRYTPTRLGVDYHRSQPLLTTEVYIQTTKPNAFLPVMVAATDAIPVRYTPMRLGADYHRSQPLLTSEVCIILQLTTN
jgi:hypothetical protein